MLDPGARILEFLKDIGLVVRIGELGPTFLPGIAIERGGLVLDEARLLYPGDLLHEAGPLAVLPPVTRAAIDGDAGDDAGYEMAAMAWSYAAALHLNIDPAVVFHNHGYRGASQSLLENFAAGRSIGVPLLEWAGLTTISIFPSMNRWLRE